MGMNTIRINRDGTVPYADFFGRPLKAGDMVIHDNGSYSGFYSDARMVLGFTPQKVKLTGGGASYSVDLIQVNDIMIERGYGKEIEKLRDQNSGNMSVVQPKVPNKFECRSSVYVKNGKICIISRFQNIANGRKSLTDDDRLYYNAIKNIISNGEYVRAQSFRKARKHYQDRSSIPTAGKVCIRDDSHPNTSELPSCTAMNQIHDLLEQVPGTDKNQAVLHNGIKLRYVIGEINDIMPALYASGKVYSVNACDLAIWQMK